MVSTIVLVSINLPFTTREYLYVPEARLPAATVSAPEDETVVLFKVFLFASVTIICALKTCCGKV